MWKTTISESLRYGAHLFREQKQSCALCVLGCTWLWWCNSSLLLTRELPYLSKLNYTLELMHLPLLLHILALSSGAWTRAFGFTVQKLHLSLAPFSKIDVPRPFHTLLHSNSRYTLGKGICSKPQVSGLDAFGLSKANPAHRSFCGIRIRFHQRWKFHSKIG